MFRIESAMRYPRGLRRYGRAFFSPYRLRLLEDEKPLRLAIRSPCFRDRTGLVGLPILVIMSGWLMRNLERPWEDRQTRLDRKRMLSKETNIPPSYEKARCPFTPLLLYPKDR